MKLLRPGFIHLQLLGELRIIKNPFGRGLGSRAQLQPENMKYRGREITSRRQPGLPHK
mgnify:CR=1 FL=1